VIFYLLCGVAAGIVHWMSVPASTMPTVGASGAIAGVLGAYFFLFPQARVIVLVPILFLPLFFELPAVTYLAIWAISQVFSGTLSLSAPEVEGVAWWAHVGGFVAGVVLHRVFVRPSRADRRPARDEYGIDNAWMPSRRWGES
jgi:membrane associated rhomboid family serine protease